MASFLAAAAMALQHALMPAAAAPVFGFLPASASDAAVGALALGAGAADSAGAAAATLAAGASGAGAAGVFAGAAEVASGVADAIGAGASSFFLHAPTRTVRTAMPAQALRR